MGKQEVDSIGDDLIQFRGFKVSVNRGKLGGVLWEIF
jgi:hypothetical protein